MYQANVYKVMFGSPSDITKEVDIFKTTVSEWNSTYSEKENIVIIPIHWKSDSYSIMGIHPQKSLNKQLVNKSDILVAVFGMRVGSPTDTHISGTIEEVEEHIKGNKPVMVFFKNSIDDMSLMDMNQIKTLQEFKNSIKDKCYYCEYKTLDEFKDLFSRQFQKIIIDSTLGFKQIEHGVIQPNLVLNDYDIERLKAWANPTNSNFMQVHFDSDSCIYGLGSVKYDVKSGRNVAEWKTFFEKLLKLDFISVDGYDKRGRPSYELKQAAYEYVERLSK